VTARRRAGTASDLTATVRIKGGAVWDPANRRRGEIGDVCIDGGRIVASLPAAAPVFDARGLVVLPGGVDLHSHIVGGAVRQARLLCPEPLAADCLPVLRETGERYARLGYTTVFDAAIAPSLAAAAHDELEALPILDRGFFVLMGNDPGTLGVARAGDAGRLADAVKGILAGACGFAVKLVNPGGVAAWRAAKGEPPLEETTALLAAFARANAALSLPHPPHVHLPRLGVPGNATLALIEGALGGKAAAPLHLTHLQFHAYGGRTLRGFRSRAPEIAARLNRLNGWSADVGQVVFGPAVTLSADAPAQERLHRATHRKRINWDIEDETGCGVVPHTYRPESLVAAVQWAAGLELMLLIEDPWRIALTTDHPNGGPFTAYPLVLRMLADRACRESILARAHPALPRRATLGAIAREYSFEELVIVTRSGPARILGLKHKGHLGPGADGDVALYRQAAAIKTTFEKAVAVFKDGRLVLHEGEILDARPGRTLYAGAVHEAGAAQKAGSILPEALSRREAI
jgi:formylmethanofuran dehydrogenase subunit A